MAGREVLEKKVEAQKGILQLSQASGGKKREWEKPKDQFLALECKSQPNLREAHAAHRIIRRQEFREERDHCLVKV